VKSHEIPRFCYDLVDFRNGVIKFANHWNCKFNLKCVERTTCNFNSEMFNKGKNKKYHSVGRVPKSNLIIVEGDQIYTTNTQIHDGLIFWLCTDASLKSDRTNVVFSSSHHLHSRLSHTPHQCLMFISVFGFIVLVI